MADLTVRPVTPTNWPDFERLFESRGAPRHCWCMVWRPKSKESSLKTEMQRIIERGVPVGLLAYDGEDPVAWCSIAPRDTYRALGGPEGEGVWSLACFFVSRAIRGMGVMKQLLGEAVNHAKANGAKVVEAYPVDPDSPSYRFMGFVPAFKEAGFEEVGRAGTRRHVMRLKLTPARSAPRKSSRTGQTKQP